MSCGVGPKEHSQTMHFNTGESTRYTFRVRNIRMHNPDKIHTHTHTHYIIDDYSVMIGQALHGRKNFTMYEYINSSEIRLFEV